MRLSLLVLALAFSGCGQSTQIQAPSPELTGLPTVPTPAFLGTGNPQNPLVVVLGMDAQSTLEPGNSWGGIPLLLNAGYYVISLDLPCPGTTQLECWATRISQGDDTIFLSFCAGLSDVLDSLSITSAGIVGVSRGGYVAITCATYDDRFKAVGLDAPVTDLNYLTEFRSLPVNEAMFNTEKYVPYMRQRHVHVRIGSDDTRVGTALAEGFATAVGATLQILDEPGHYTAEDGSTITFFQKYPW